jgi:hypothetical protein
MPARVSEPVVISRETLMGVHADKTRFRPAAADEHMHPLEEDPSFNESMYFNAFDPRAGVGGFFRLGNRANEGYAEMTVCLYLPDGRVGFMFARPPIDSNEAFDAGGMRFEVERPMELLRVSYAGPLALLADPLAMKDPKAAFGAAEHVDCEVALEYRGLAPAFGGEGLAGFARGHYEQHVGARGRIAAGEASWELDGFGLRDHSWGPRSWHAPRWYRWLTCAADERHGFMVAIVATADGEVRRSGVLLADGEYEPIQTAEITTETEGEDRYHRRLRCLARTAGSEVEITGEVRSLIPLRHRGKARTTRISEALTEFRWDGRAALGMSEYLDDVSTPLTMGS